MRMKMHARKDNPILQETRHMTEIDFGHHYPDGGWGWMVVAIATLVYALCHGFHFAFGTIFMVCTYEAKDDEKDLTDDPGHSGRNYSSIVWLGSISFSISLFVSPILTVICQRYSLRPRVVAAVGGLITFLGCLFLSFATTLHHVFISVVLLSIASGVTITTANIIVGRYFRQRRDLAEMIVLSGTGLGAALISFLVHDLCRKFDWVKAMISLAVLLLATSVLAGLTYRPTSVYHPRKNILLYIKNQKKCRREEEKPSYNDFTPLRMRGLQVLMFIVAVIGFGMHVPVILLIYTAQLHGIEDQSLMLLNVLFGCGYAVGCYFIGCIVVKDNNDCSISRRNLAQACAITSGAFTLLFIMAKDFQAYALYACAFGVTSGGYHYAVKMYTYELVKEKIMEQAWGFVSAAQFISVLFGSPIAIFLNESNQSEVACYIFAGVTTLFGGFLFSGMPFFEKHYSNHETIQRYQCICSKNAVEAAALLDLDLSNVVVTRPSNTDQCIISPNRTHTHGREGSLIQMQCFIQHRDKEKPKQIVLSRITEEKEGLRLDFNEISQPSSSSSAAAKSSSENSRQKSVSEKDLSSLPVCENHCADMPSESTNSNNTSSNKGNNSSRSDKKFRRSSENVRLDYFDPPSQEKESTATVSYDSDLYINLCEAQV